MQSQQRQVRLFRNGRNQAIRIPREFEMDASEAIIRKNGDILIIEPVREKSLLKLVSSWTPLKEDFPDIEDIPVTGEDIF